MTEKRIKAYKPCVVEGCDWRLVTEWFVDGPDKTRSVSMTEQQLAAGLHMRLHYKPERTTFI